MRLLTDIPVTSAKDGLGFLNYSNALADAIYETSGPLTIGVFGEWGTGKSSLMGMIEERLLEKYPGEVATVRFNAWRYEREQHPVVPLISVMLKSLQEQRDFVELHKEQCEKLGEELGSLVAAITLGAVKVVEPNTAPQESEINKDIYEEVLNGSVYFNAFDRLESVELEGKARIVVFVDDLDRCFPDKAITLLESIKLVLNHQDFAFVLGADRRVLEGYLDHRYQEQYGLVDFSGSSYLDKIVQLPFFIPPHYGRIADYSKTLLKELGLEDDSEWSEVLKILIPACRSNPRSTVRMVNNLVVDQGISEQMYDSQDSIPVGLFAVTRALQHRWGEVYRLLVRDQVLSTEVASWANGGGEPVFPERGTDNEEIGEKAQNLLTVLKGDTDLQKVLFSEPGLDWLNTESRRDAASSFLRMVRRQVDTISKTEVRKRAEPEYDIFLSGAHDLSQRIGELLQLAGLRVFWSAAIRSIPGEFTSLSERALRNSAILLVLIDEELSTWALQELDIFLRSKELDLRLLPVLIGGELPSILREYVALDLRSRKPAEYGEEILRAVRSMLDDPRS